MAVRMGLKLESLENFGRQAGRWSLSKFPSWDQLESNSVSGGLRVRVAASPPLPRVDLPLRTQSRNSFLLGSASFDYTTSGIRVSSKHYWLIGLLPNTVGTRNNKETHYTSYKVGAINLPSWIKLDTLTATLMVSARANSKLSAFHYMEATTLAMETLWRLSNLPSLNT
ncbi:hypothetical protein O181_006800 [Austropuccinia psidii MF-1]|uniref:Uncharacterized protein n=1 Tax=Austropuccinia psidii MF-1 TaxID=1389203 RepID=A0A9Q3BLP5_9BASI|nr:hypothetical protein [Austropuccinia psidii MF-1]